jgi:hypothetical protein
MEELFLLISRLRAIQAFSEEFGRRCRRGEAVSIEIDTQALPPARSPRGWLRDAAQQITDGLRIRFRRPVTYAARALRFRPPAFGPRMAARR